MHTIKKKMVTDPRDYEAIIYRLSCFIHTVPHVGTSSYLMWLNLLVPLPLQNRVNMIVFVIRGSTPRPS